MVLTRRCFCATVEWTGPKNRSGGGVVGDWVVMESGNGGVGMAAGTCTAAGVGTAAAAAAIGVDVGGGRTAAACRW
jgi:hypothetical protein